MKKLLAILCMSTCLCGVSVTSYAAETEAVEAISEEVVVDTEEETSGTSEDILSSEAYMTYGSTFDNLVKELRSYSDEELNIMLAEAPNEANVQLLESWMGIKDNVGAYIGVLSCEAVEEEEELTVTMKFDFTEKDVTMNYVATAEAVTIGFETELTTMEIFKKAGLNTLIGMGTTFIILIFISLLISTFSFLPKLFAGKEKKAELPVEEKKPEPVVEVEEELTDDLELVAVITAAIAAAEGTSTDGVVIRSIKRANNAKWKRA